MNNVLEYKGYIARIEYSAQDRVLYGENDKNPGSTRDAQRFVTGSDGSVYYTDDHYSAFTKLK